MCKLIKFYVLKYVYQKILSLSYFHTINNLDPFLFILFTIINHGLIFKLRFILSKLKIQIFNLVFNCIFFIMSGSTGERPFADILTSIRYWVIHSITVPSLFIAGWLYVSLFNSFFNCKYRTFL